MLAQIRPAGGRRLAPAHSWHDGGAPPDLDEAASANEAADTTLPKRRRYSLVPPVPELGGAVQDRLRGVADLLPAVPEVRGAVQGRRPALRHSASSGASRQRPRLFSPLRTSHELFQPLLAESVASSATPAARRCNCRRCAKERADTETQAVRDLLHQDGYSETDPFFHQALLLCSNWKQRRDFLRMKTREGREQYVKMAWQAVDIWRPK